MAEDSNGSAPNHFLPEEIEAELRRVLDPNAHFYGEYKLVIHDGHVSHTEKTVKIRTPIEKNRPGRFIAR
jgi:hypothetical protein